MAGGVLFGGAGEMLESAHTSFCFEDQQVYHAIMPAVKKASDKSPIDGRVEQDGVREVSLARETAPWQMSLPAGGPSDGYLWAMRVCACRRRRHGRVVFSTIACRLPGQSN